ncbi:hypothetical protein G6O69_28160 [Pseudenhygromyxa sp. WMMC2535]|uniref:hypothetical protein n=1 Tax=Pseudenhygromyxa sp. WMMC2535 TaxID=2712867 RepID=UPI001554B146|nr:hypothetical protein [Pseudenhygromyxa sp. WMMC2535]NVB41741.1 hypothetical protein [Pseudenhygromyxa sp. WMMC2535]
MNKFTSTMTKYSAFRTNTPFKDSYYHNCTSHAQVLMSEIGLSWFAQKKGWWSPSLSGWFDCIKSFTPMPVNGFYWKYHKYNSVNTVTWPL